MEDSIEMIDPSDFQKVGTGFFICGYIPKSWLETDSGLDYTVYVEFFDINGEVFTTTSINIRKPNFLMSRLRKNKKKFLFRKFFQFDNFNFSSIVDSKGLINIRLRGHNDDYELSVPIIIKGDNPNFKAKPELLDKHAKLGEMIAKYEIDLKNYNRQFKELQERRRVKSGISKEDEGIYRSISDLDIKSGLLNLLARDHDVQKDFLFAEEDKEERQLKEKYKDALEWRGPLLGGVFASLNGFAFQVYSDDHDKHFHVLHRGRGINARFSFPEIEFINYKYSKSTIGSKERKEIIRFLKSPEIFSKLEKEFIKRDGDTN